MAERKKPVLKYIVGGAVGFIVVFVAVFFGVQFFTKTGIFRIPGVVYYDESLTDEEVSLVKTVLNEEELDLNKDVMISAYNSLERPEAATNEFLIDIFVPVTDFYSTATDIEIESVEALFTNCLDCEYSIIPVEKLEFSKKLLKINGEYYLDSFDTGAVFRTLKFESEKYDEEILPLLIGKFERDFPSKDTVLTLAQTGVTAFSRLMNGKMNEVNDGEYFAEEIGEYLASFDLTHTSNESSFWGQVSTSGATGVPICADDRFKTTLLSIGLDIVELTGNHNRDCGMQAASETVDWYQENGIKIVGGGKNATEAAVPLEIDEKGNQITMLAFNQSTGGATYGDAPGANQYYEDVAASQIEKAKERGDFVIVDVQYYECNAYASTYEDPICDYADSAAGDQVGFFRHLIDLGADVVVGTSAHQPQTFELYGDGVIYYGLGNLFFDQFKWPGTTRSLILVHHIYKDKLLQTEVVPTIYDSAMQTRLLDEETATWFLERLISERP